MSEEIKKDQVEIPSDTTTPAQTIDTTKQIEEMKAQLKLEMIEEFKSEIAGLNRKNSELQGVIKEKDLEGKTEAEKNELLKLENAKIQKEIEESNRGRLIDQELNNAGLPLDFAKRIIGQDDANIKQDVLYIKDYLDKLAQEKAEGIINEKMGGKPPEAGINPNPQSMDEQIKKAQEAGNFPLVMALKEQKLKQ